MILTVTVNINGSDYSHDKNNGYNSHASDYQDRNKK